MSRKCARQKRVSRACQKKTTIDYDEVFCPNRSYGYHKTHNSTHYPKVELVTKRLLQGTNHTKEDSFKFQSQYYERSSQTKIEELDELNPKTYVTV
jgi:hypothetical protein